MPAKMPKVCRQVGCAGVSTGRDGYCDVCRVRRRKQYETHHRNKEHKAIYATSRWRRLRLDHLGHHPFCERCGALAAIVHHKIPHRGDLALAYDPSNLESLCARCHRAAHRAFDGAVTG